MLKPSVQDLFFKESVFILPTDTLYGISASAFSKKAVERIYRIKGRSETKPFIILIASLSDLKKFGVRLSSSQRVFLKNVWPNPISIILPMPQKKFTYLHRGTESLAFRIPKKKSLQSLLKKTGPLVAPSANPQGLKPAETIEQAKKYFGDLVDMYIDEGQLKRKPSTLVSLLENKPVLLRQGSFKIPKGFL